jgi:hypothetical protein
MKISTIPKRAEYVFQELSNDAFKRKIFLQYICLAFPKLRQMHSVRVQKEQIDIILGMFDNIKITTRCAGQRPDGDDRLHDQYNLCIEIALGRPRLRARRIALLDELYLVMVCDYYINDDNEYIPTIERGNARIFPSLLKYYNREQRGLFKAQDEREPSYEAEHPHVSRGGACYGDFDSGLINMAAQGNVAGWFQTQRNWKNNWYRHSAYWDINHYLRPDDNHIRGNVMDKIAVSKYIKEIGTDCVSNIWKKMAYNLKKEYNDKRSELPRISCPNEKHKHPNRNGRHSLEFISDNPSLDALSAMQVILAFRLASKLSVAMDVNYISLQEAAEQVDTIRDNSWLWLNRKWFKHETIASDIMSSLHYLQNDRNIRVHPKANTDEWSIRHHRMISELEAIRNNLSYYVANHFTFKNIVEWYNNYGPFFTEDLIRDNYFLQKDDDYRSHSVYSQLNLTMEGVPMWEGARDLSIHYTKVSDWIERIRTWYREKYEALGGTKGGYASEYYEFIKKQHQMNMPYMGTSDIYRKRNLPNVGSESITAMKMDIHQQTASYYLEWLEKERRRITNEPNNTRKDERQTDLFPVRI